MLNNFPIKGLLFSIILLGGCSSVSMIESDLDGDKAKEIKATYKEEIKNDWLEQLKGREPVRLAIRPGEVSKLVVKGPFPKKGVLECNKKKFQYYSDGNKLISFVSETYFSDLKPYSCFFKEGERIAEVASVTVFPKEFPSEKLKVNKRRVFLNKKDSARAERERELRERVFFSSPDRPYFEGPFELPIDSLVTSIYGSKRIFNDKKETQHLGTDYRAPVGVPIKSANRGVVVLSRDFFYTGHTVIIDHGLGILTLYGHLSKRLVEEGEVVPAGTAIGLAGATGRTTGPHLHWGVTVNGLAIEGESLVKASQGI